jgi:hypothetical protein
MDEQDQVQHIGKRYRETKDYWSEQHDHTKMLMRFNDGDQWEDGTEALRIASGRPCEVMNFTHVYTNRICNPYLINPIGATIELPQIDLASFGVQTPEGFDLQDLLVGVMADIEDQSRAKDAYFHAFRCAVIGGVGYWMLGRDYADDDGIDQKICVEMVLDPTKVYFDPASVLPDGSDGRFAFYVGEIPKEQAEQEIGDSRESLSYNLNIGSRTECTKGFVPEVLYFERASVKYWKFFLQDGRAFSADEIPEGIYYDPQNRVLTDGVNVIPAQRRRMEKKISRVWRFVDSVLVEKTELPISSLGIIRVIGDRVSPAENERVYFTGATNWIKTSQKLVNYYGNNELEVSGLAPRAPWVGSQRAFAGHDEWDDANRVAYSKLEYNDIDPETGVPIAPPQRADNNAQTAPSMNSRLQAMQDMGLSIGITPEMLGNAIGANDSGKAVFLRNEQGEIPTAHYHANLHQAISYSADSMIDLMPMVYDTDREFVLTNQEGKKVVVTLNLAEILKPQLRKYIKTKVASGPSFEAKRREGLETLNLMMTTLGTINPAYVPPFAKALLKNSGAIGADDALKSLAKIDPAFADEVTTTEVPVEELQKVQASYEEEIAQLEGQLQQFVEIIRQMQNELQSSKDDNETKLQIAEMNNQVKVLIESMKIQNDQVLQQKDLISSAVNEALKAMSQKEKEDEDEDENEDDRQNRSESVNQSVKNVNLEENPEDVNLPTLVKGGSEIFKGVDIAD